MVRKKTIGTTYQTKVKSHSRKIGKGRGALGRFITRKTSVKSHVRNVRNLGSPGEIPRRPIIKFERRFTIFAKRIPEDFEIPKNAQSFFTGTPEQIKLKILEYYKKVEQVVSKGIDQGISMFEVNGLKYVSQRSGALRKDVMNTLRDHRKTFPIIVYIGAPHTKYAKILNRATPSTMQLQHNAGKQMSGTGNSASPYAKNPYPYNAGKGDPEAQYQFFGKAVMNAQSNIQEQVMDLASSQGIPYAVFFMYVKITLKLGSMSDE